MTANPALASGTGGFGRLWAAAIGSNLADGIARLAIPLSAVAITKDPMAIALLAALMYVPWLLFSVPSGMIVDRIDRRWAMAIANLARVVAAVAVALFIATDNITITVLAIAVVVFGLGETLFDNATNAITPTLVGRKGLDKANGMIQAAQVGVDTFVATPISGVLFSIAVVLPMIVGGAGYLVAIVLVLALPVAAARARGADGERVAPVPLRAALGFVWHHHYLRSLVLFTASVGTFYALAQAITVLLFLDKFSVSPALIGVVTAGLGLGAVAGSLLAGTAVKRFGRGHVMFAATVLGGAGLVGVGLSPNAWVATVAYGFSAAGVSMWNVPWGSLRQAIIPEHMLGRAIGAIRTFTWSLMPIATLAGGWIAKVDLQLPYLVGGGLSVVIAILGFRLLMRADDHYPSDEPADEEATQGEADAVAPEEASSPVAPVATPIPN